MRKLLFILFIFIFASSASAAVYKWVDERGVVNFADDYSKVPPDYRNKVEEVSISKMGPSGPSQPPLGNIAVAAQSGETPTQAPPIAQTLIREGDFAIKLAEALKIGGAKSEAEAESMLVSVGISPKNGWIADYPVTPDIIGELQNAIGAAVDSGNLRMTKNETITALQDLAARQGLPVRADTEGPYAGVEPPRDYGEYSRPEVINNYYYNQGPPIVTYYPPPWDYYYLYAWVPYPFWCSGFWCSGFWFPGFFVLHDFDTIIIVNRRGHRFTNHFFHPRWRRTVTIDPARRSTERPFRAASDHPRTGGYSSAEARTGASSIFERSHERARSGSSAMVRPDRGPNGGSSPSRSGNKAGRQTINKMEGNTPTFRGQSGDQTRQPVIDRRTTRSPSESNLDGAGGPRGSRGMTGRTFTPPGNIERRSGMSFQRPSQGEVRSFSPPAQGSPRSFSTPHVGGGASLGMPQSGGRSGGFGHGF